jgi:hypothetical protein
VLRKSISVDVHTHGGKTGVTSKAPPNDDLANAMRAGSLAVACLADVPDGPVLGRNADGVLAAVRPPEPGQLYRHHLERLAWMDEMVANHGLRRALSSADLEAAHKAGEPAVIADVEGLDFLETKLERLEEAHQRGIRHVQLVHYTPNVRLYSGRCQGDFPNATLISFLKAALAAGDSHRAERLTARPRSTRSSNTALAIGERTSSGRVIAVRHTPPASRNFGSSIAVPPSSRIARVP